MEDEFIKEHIEELLRNIRQQVLVKVIRPYTKVRIQFLSQVSMKERLHLICMLLVFEKNLNVLGFFYSGIKY